MILYDFKRGLQYTESHKNLMEAFGDDAPSKATVNNWFDEFKRGRLSLEDEAHPGRPMMQLLPKTCVLSPEWLKNIETWHLWRFRRPWGLVPPQSIQYCTNILASGSSLVDGYHIYCRMRKNNNMSIGASLCWRNLTMVAQNRFPTLALVTKHGFMRTIRKQSSNPLYGSMKMSRLRQRWPDPEVLPRKWWQFSLENRVRLRKFHFWNNIRSMRSGVVNLGSQMYSPSCTMRDQRLAFDECTQFATATRTDRFFARIRYSIAPTSTVQSRFGTKRFFLFPEIKKHLRRKRFGDANAAVMAMNGPLIGPSTRKIIWGFWR